MRKNSIKEVWSQFKEKIKVFPWLLNDLNPGCGYGDIKNIEEKMGISFPNDLRELYLMNNGQKGKEDGIFKAISGYSKASHTKFLPLRILFLSWKCLKSEKELDVFKDTDIPFAADRPVKDFKNNTMDDVFCINTETEEVCLLWVAAYDWTLPYDWQTNRIKQANNLAGFLIKQIELY